jgi:hypothetical protein
MSNQYTDLEVICKDCGNGFTLTAGEQEFFASRGMVNPKRCPKCRIAKRQNADRQNLENRREYAG